MQIIDVIFQEFWHDFNSDSILKEYKLDIYEICQNMQTRIDVMWWIWYTIVYEVTNIHYIKICKEYIVYAINIYREPKIK